MDLQQSFDQSNLTAPRRPLTYGRRDANQVCGMLAGKVPGVAKDWLVSEEFILVDIPVHFATTPYRATDPNAVLAGLQASAESDCGIVVEMNRRQVGRTPGGNFIPPVIVIAGTAAVEAARMAGRERVRAWVGELAAAKLGLLHADHQLSSSELNSQIQNAHDQATGWPGYGNNMPDGSKPPDRRYVGDVYPMENYHVFSQDGKHYKQKHSVDLPSRTVKLVGKPQEVKQKWVGMHAQGVETPPMPIPHEAPTGGRSGGRTARRNFTSGGPTMLQPVTMKSDAVKLPRKSGMTIEDTVSAFGGVGMGNASGPPYATGLGTQPAAERTKMRAHRVGGKPFPGARRKAVKAGKKPVIPEAKILESQSSPGSYGNPVKEDANTPAGKPGVGNYIWHRNNQPTVEEYGGASKSENRARMLQKRKADIGAAAISKIVSKFEAAVASGYKVPKVWNVAPPGMEHVVKGLKKHFPAGSASPFKLAWWLKDRKSKKK